MILIMNSLIREGRVLSPSMVQTASQYKYIFQNSYGAPRANILYEGKHLTPTSYNVGDQRNGLY